MSNKVILLGAPSVGKTALAVRMSENIFDAQTRPTLQSEGRTLKVPYAGIVHSFSLWDTAGQERFRSQTQMYYRNAVVGIVVFSFDIAQSLPEADSWVTDLRTQNPNARIILVGNKTDMEPKEVTHDDGCDANSRLGAAAYIETSAKTGEGIEDLTTEVVRQIMNLREEQCISVQTSQPLPLDTNPAVVTLDSSNSRRGKRCC
jgi:Ras-related protein Rab-5C